MKTIEQIYTDYKIMPTLREHMYRVAAIAYLICDSIADFNDKQNVIIACLLHDMGNIIKFKLGHLPEFLEPEGLDYWQQVQDEFKKKFSDDEHNATLKIAKEIGVSENVLNLIDIVGFPNGEKNLIENNLSKMICGYSDMRVAPHGVLPLAERLEDLRKRYIHRHPTDDGSFGRYSNSFLQMEDKIFNQASIKSTEITDEKITGIIKELKNFIIR